MGELKKIKALSVNTDIDELLMKDDEGRFIKNYRIDTNANANLATGTGSNAPSGANFGIRTKLRSNDKVWKIDAPLLPSGKNKKIGGGYCATTNEYYYFNFNKKGVHGIYVIDGDTMLISKVLVDPTLNFSSNPLYEIPSHCMELWLVYDSDDVATRKVKEKYLLWTDSNNWQGYLNVKASMKTNGFDATIFPYWTLKQPHFDRRELFEWPVRPIMPAPTINPVELTDADKGKHNSMLLRSFQFAVETFYTDGRPSTVSQWSEPYYLDKSSCNINSQNLKRCVDITMQAGSPMTERIRILVKNCDGDWYAVETINKYSTCDENDPSIIKDDYWKRIKPWDAYSYDPVFNTLTYRFCNNKECKQVSQTDVLRIQSDMPLRTVGLTAVGNTMLLADNEYGYPNVNCETLKNISLSVENVKNKEQCVTPSRKITLYAFIGRDGSFNQLGYKMATDDTVVKFGGVTKGPGGVISVDPGESDAFNLNFGDKTGPLLYLAGTPLYAIGKQYKVNPDFTKELFGIPDMSLQENKDLVASVYNQGGFFIWQFDFSSIPPSKYIARLAGHSCSESEDYAITSTYCAGITDSRLCRHGNIFNSVLEPQEIEIDCCNADVDLWGNGKDSFFIFCPYSYKEGDNQRWRFITGNVYEDSKDSLPVPLIKYLPDQGFPNYVRAGYYTDHNGFYWAYTARGDAKTSNVDFWSKFNCVIHVQNTFIAQTRNLPAKERGYYPNEMIYLDSFNAGKFGDCNRILVRGKITDCDGVTGLSGVSVTMTRGDSAITGSDGSFEMVVHNSNVQIRTDRIYFNTGGICLLNTCDCSCDPVENYSDAFVPCISCNIRVYPTTLSRKYKLSLKPLKSMKGGGRNGVGMNEWDLAGRCGFINNIGYLDIPTFLEKKNFDPSLMKATITNPLKLRPSTKWVSFFRTANLNYSTYLQWVGDKIEFLNTKGEVVQSSSAAVRARITIQSLNEFNKAQTFGNTTKYQFVQGDIVRIYDDGNNNMFDPLTSDGFLDFNILGTNWNQANEDLGVVETSVVAGAVTTKTTVPVEDGKSFIIPFDKRLIPLQKTCGFWLEIMRLKTCSTAEKYCEITGMYPVINGEIVEFKGFDTNGVPLYDLIKEIVFNTWDTYYQRRFFKIKDCGGKFFNHPFESASISDYWGDNCGSCGREWVRNENAEQRWHPLDTIKSDDFVNDGGYNGLGTFRDANRKVFKGQHWGPITGVHADNSIVAFICGNNWFLTDFNMNYLRATETGVVLANLDNSLSEPKQKIGMEFGCALVNKGAIVIGDNFITWPDSLKSGVIIMDYRGAGNVGEIDNDSYFSDKFQFVNKFNSELSPDAYLDNLIDIIMGYDPMYKDILITFRPRRNFTDDINSYINDERETFLAMQETFVFNMGMKKWVRYAGYAPEGYGQMDKAKTGKELLSFAKSYPYTHNSAGVNTFNTFYGVKTQAVQRIIFNDGKDKEKILQAWAIESNNHKHVITNIRTNEVNCFSYVPSAYMKKKENIWYSKVLRDMNSYPSADPVYAYRRMLIDGKRLFGTFFDITIVADPEKLDEYCEVDNVLLRAIGSELSDK